jgi:beta-xylosidase
MIEGAMIWNEPNNKSHWDPEIDPDWTLFAEMTKLAGRAIRDANPTIPRVLGGMSPIDPGFVNNLAAKGVMDALDEWPAKVDEIRAVTPAGMPVWVSEVGISTFGAEEVQVFGLDRTAALLKGKVPRIHWY